MAQITVVSINKRRFVVNVTWSDGLARSGIEINDVPVEDFEQAHAYLTNHIIGIYAQVRAEADAEARANPVAHPAVLATIGKTFNELGQLVS